MLLRGFTLWLLSNCWDGTTSWDALQPCQNCALSDRNLYIPWVKQTHRDFVSFWLDQCSSYHNCAPFRLLPLNNPWLSSNFNWDASYELNFTTWWNCHGFLYDHIVTGNLCIPILSNRNRLAMGLHTQNITIIPQGYGGSEENYNQGLCLLFECLPQLHLYRISLGKAQTEFEFYHASTLHSYHLRVSNILQLCPLVSRTVPCPCSKQWWLPPYLLKR